jgi:diguanylate cyclase (GGDEF)-like protein/PAS domain S-box-containing protein
VADSAGPTRLSRPAREAALAALLGQFPDAWVVAIRTSGHFTSMPPSVPLSGHRVISGPASALELVVPGDRSIVIETWSRALAEGEANASVHPYGNAGRLVGMHIVDATEDHGVYIGVFVGYGADGEPEASEPPDLVPRTSVIRKDRVGVILAVDEAATAILGWPAHELVGHRALEFVHPDDQDRAVAHWMEMIGRRSSSQRVRLRHRHRDGSWRWLEVTNHNKLDEPERCVIAEMVDVTEEVTAIDALRANERLLLRLTEALPVGVLHIGADGSVDYGNERLAAIVGVDRAGTADEQFSTAIGDGRDVLRAAVSTVLTQGRDQDVSVSFAPRPGVIVHCEVSLRALADEAGQTVGAIVCVVDTTEDQMLREELQHRARYDQLTGCLNHASVMAELAERLPAAGPDQFTVALFIDLNDFKGINDRHGHAAGDHVLRHIADELQEIAHGDDLVGRLGGDEFLVVMRTGTDRALLARIARRVTAALDHAIAWEGEWIVPAASVGVAYARPGAGVSPDTLVSAADAAMYESKRDSRPVLTEARP